MRQPTPDEETQKLPVLGETPQRASRQRWLLRVATALLGASVLGSIAVVITFAVVASDLPKINSLADYQPKQATVVYGKDGQIVARFATERRTVVPFARIPKTAVDAVVSAEDAEFFEHGGIDYPGIFRCVIKNALAGRKLCGGSTITQQMVKTFLLTSKKTYSRKLKELILAKRVEDSLSKEDILYLYLNQINYGRAYGLQEAAQVYFGKDVDQLELAETALLTGLPQSPARLDPYRYPERALARRTYVLKQMRKHGKISESEFDDANRQPLRLDWKTADSALDSNTHYAAHIKRRLIELFGEEQAIDGGLRVYTGLDPKLQRVAEEQLHEGVRALDKRQGWRGPLLHLELDQMSTLIERLEVRRSTLAASLAELDDASSTSGYQPVVWNLSRLRNQKTSELDEIVDLARFSRFELDRTYAGIVTDIDDGQKEATVSLGSDVHVQIPLRTGMAWARKFDLLRITRRPRVPSDVLERGDVVFVRPTVFSRKKDRAQITGALEQYPRVQSALVSIDPITREVRAMVGGYGSGAGTFNRVTQSRRQAGSTFKPLLYSAAFENKHFTTVSKCTDAPHVYRDPWTGKEWKPRNYDGKFDGEITLRLALTKSKNLCSVWLIHQVGIEPTIEMAQRLGIESSLPKTDTLALGSGDVTVLELANAYATLASRGERAEPIFIRKVIDPENKILFEAKDERKQVLAPEIAYQVTSLMQSVVEDGTARAVKKLGRPVAGKTGTTNEARNAWFAGFTPDLVTVVWTGFDDNEPLGPGESGGRAAIPIWLGFMEQALEATPVQDFAAPGNIVFAFVDPGSGLLAPPDSPDASNEPFIAGTEPTEMMTTAKPPENFGLDDYEP